MHAPAMYGLIRPLLSMKNCQQLFKVSPEADHTTLNTSFFAVLWGRRATRTGPVKPFFFQSGFLFEMNFLGGGAVQKTF